MEKTQESAQEPLNIKDSLISLVRNTAFGGLFPRSEKEMAEAQAKAEQSKQEKYQTKLNDIKVKSAPLWQNAIMDFVWAYIFSLSCYS
ncbi:hypothetical protein OFP60_02875 [Brachyspira hyodysenteriae]|nr:hypothetical protein [Brachyspira hyodysenteriae]MCZ9894016.1 hypothetical protein [Brachyspira hyodysenteriae]